MHFPPKTENELRPPLLPAGEYDADIVEAKEERSKNNNDMIHLTFSIYDINGRQHYIHDYLMVIEGMEYKIRHFCYTNKLENEYDSGFIDAAVCLKVKKCRIKVKIKKDTTGQYPDKNVIADYLSFIGLEYSYIFHKNNKNQ